MIKGKLDEYPTLSEILRGYVSSFNRVENFLNLKPGFFFVFSARKVEGNRGPYYECTVGDASIRVEAKVWVSEPGLLEPQSNFIALADYTYDDRYGFSLKVKKNFSLEEMENYSERSTSQLLPVVGDISKIEMDIGQLVDELRNSYLKHLLEGLIGPRGSCREFFDAPAAKLYHHALIGGLAKHSLAVTRYALALYEVSLSRELINRDLLVAGSLLHDIGKVKTYSTQGYAFDYTDSGQLEDHIALGIRLLGRAIDVIKDFPSGLERELFHIVLSHHGELQFGSPVSPKSREALIVAHCDSLDSKLDHFDKLAASTPGDVSWTEYSKMFQSRLYKGIEEPSSEI